MRRVSLFALCGSLVLLLLSCQTREFSQNRQPGSLNWVAGIYPDSLRQSDPWLKYSYEERKGKRLFDHYCLVCHGETGEGDGFNAYNLDPRPHSLADSTYISVISDAIIEEVIARGGRGVNKSVLMPAYANTLSKEQIQYLVKYIRTLARH